MAQKVKALKVSKKWQRWAKQLKKREAAFKKMTPAQKRVAIAKDVIAQLDAKLIKAKRGVYFENDKVDDLTHRATRSHWDPKITEYVPPIPELAKLETRDAIMSASQTCSACAVGSIFVAGMLRADKCTLGERGGMSEYNYANKFFTYEQLRHMETVFECGCFYKEGFNRYGCGIGDATQLPEASADERLRWIMNNIIKNKGTFKPKLDKKK